MRNPFFRLVSLWFKREKVADLAGFVREKSCAVEKIQLLPVNERMTDVLDEKLKNTELVITSAGMGSIEISNTGTSKGEALSVLCTRLKIKPEEFMAIGDRSGHRRG